VEGLRAEDVARLSGQGRFQRRLQGTLICVLGREDAAASGFTGREARLRAAAFAWLSSAHMQDVFHVTWGD
jgi:hypothetical protein